MDLFGKNKEKKHESEKDEQALQSVLDDTEKSLEGDELQKAVKEKKNELNQRG